VEEAKRVAEELSLRGIEALIDDRDERPGIKFKDADLVGIPLRVTFGEKNYEAGYAEIRDRKTGETERVGISAVVDRVCAAVEEKRKECTP
jgi:prolyl-tRNA synthetase